MRPVSGQCSSKLEVLEIRRPRVVLVCSAHLAVAPSPIGLADAFSFTLFAFALYPMVLAHQRRAEPPQGSTSSSDSSSTSLPLSIASSDTCINARLGIGGDSELVPDDSWFACCCTSEACRARARLRHLEGWCQVCHCQRCRLRRHQGACTSKCTSPEDAG